MKKLAFGVIVSSMAGHDFGNFYIIIGTDEKYVYLADGKIRTVEHPKKKKKKHVQFMQEAVEELVSNQLQNRKITNEQIKYALKQFKNAGNDQNSPR